MMVFMPFCAARSRWRSYSDQSYTPGATSIADQGAHAHHEGGGTTPWFETASAIVLLLVDLFLPARRKHWTGWLALLGVAISLIITLANFDVTGEAFGGMFVADAFTSFVNVIVLLSAGLGILLAMDYLRRTDMDRNDYYLLLLFTTSGMMFMAGANDLITIFVALELLSIPLYVLSGFRSPEAKSEESALKYFLLGAFASGFLVYGIAMIYGAAGTTDLTGIWAAVGEIVAAESNAIYLLLLGTGLITVGLGFKVAAVPFHMWTPDVYEGAPTPVTAFMSVGTKAASFAALLRILVIGLPMLMINGEAAAAWTDTLAIIAALTMLLGNFVAITQTNIKRMLAYSTISQLSYIVMAAAVLKPLSEIGAAIRQFRDPEGALAATYDLEGMPSTYEPISATVVKQPIYDLFLNDPADPESRMHFFRDISTYGGCAGAMAASLENIRIIEAENLTENSRVMGGYLLDRMRELLDHPKVGDVRGKGLFLGVELVADKTSKAPPGEAQVGAVVDAIKEMGYGAQAIPGAQRTAVGLIGNDGRVDTGSLSGMSGVLECIPVTQPYKQVSREWREDDTVIELFNGTRIGGSEVVVMAGPDADIKPGHALPMELVPLGTQLHNIELKPGKGGQMVRSAGTAAQIMAKEGKYTTLRMPSGEMRMVLSACIATIGQVGNSDHSNLSLGKAGRSRWLGVRPQTRGTAMNPVDHPHGGGEGRNKGRHPVSPWGKPTKGAKTRGKKNSDRLIVARRRRK